jgi:7-cyano-7-deazaguanine synthase in queuosine biosynthesis
VPSYTLRIARPEQLTAAESRSAFFWLPGGGDSFIRTHGPGLGGLGPVAPLNRDLVRLAVTAYAADRSTPRAGRGSNWSSRELELTIPVSDPSRWTPVGDRLAALLGFLSGDSWTLHFTQEEAIAERIANTPTPVSRVVLLSGGADSAVGALLSRHELGGEAHALVSHFSSDYLPSIQRAIASEIATLIAGPDQQHEVIHLTRRSAQASGPRFANEYSTRSRSLLFIALGLAVASIHRVTLWIPENGFASLNPPLGADRRGSLSTRTTHPFFLDGLRTILADVGAHGDVTNPLQGQSKGEIFALAAKLAGPDNASRLLSQTLSCAHTGHKTHGYSIKVGCGVCFGCLVRRAAFAAAGLVDRSAYLPRSEPRLARYLADKSAERAVQLFVARGIRATDIAAMSLPSGSSTRDALQVCERAIGELGLLFE